MCASSRQCQHFIVLPDLVWKLLALSLVGQLAPGACTSGSCNACPGSYENSHENLVPDWVSHRPMFI
jgi:hypothetical protein